MEHIVVWRQIVIPDHTPAIGVVQYGRIKLLMLICDLYNKNKLRLSESNSVLAFEIITYRNVLRYII